MNRMATSYQFLCLTILALFMLASAYAFPQVDDYTYAVRTLQIGWWGAQIHEYFNWNGRFVATGFLTGGPLVWGSLLMYRLLPLTLLLAYFFSLSFLLKNWPRFTGDRSARYFWALSLTALFVLAQPTIAQGFFWFASAYTYVISAVFANIAAGFLLKTKRSFTSLFMAGLFSVFVIGCNETAMIIWLYLLSAFVVWKFYSTKTIDKGAVAVLTLSIAAGLFVLLAPGNAIRASAFEGNHRVLFTLGNGIAYSFIFPIRFLTVAILTFCLAFSNRLSGDWNTKDLVKIRFQTLAVWMGIIFISFAPSLWAMGRKPNDRTLDLILHFYLVGLFLIVPLFFNLAYWRNFLLSKAKFQIAIVALAFMALIANKPMLSLARGFAGEFQSYEQNWLKMISGETVGLLAPEQRTPILYAKDIEEHETVFKTFLSLRPDFFKDNAVE